MLLADGMHLYQFVLVGGFWFWILAAALLVGVTILTEQERGFWAFVCVVGFLAVIQLLGNANVLGYIWHHPHYVLGGVLLYYAAGVGYSLARWKLFCDNERSDYDTAKADFLDEKKVKYTDAHTAVVPAELVGEWKVEMARKLGTERAMRFLEGIKFRHHVGRCMTWASYWPCSMFWTLLNDPMRKAFKYSVVCLKSYYEAIAVRSLSGVEKDFVVPPPVVKEPEDVAMGADGLPLNQYKN